VPDDPIEELAQSVNKQRAAQDGLGWWIDYVCRLVKCYPSFTKRYVTNRLPMVEGWAWYAFAFIDDPISRFEQVKPTNGFIKQESEKLIEQAHKAWDKQN
jgi:hypothetical protein